jgi:hypothetical protein
MKGEIIMKRNITNGSIVVLLGLIVLVTGCASYYKVNDPQTGKVYYTQKIDELKSGAVRLKDDRSGNAVTIQNSEIKQLSSDEYHAGLAAQETTLAPAAAPAVAPPEEPTVSPEPAPAVITVAPLKPMPDATK